MDTYKLKWTVLEQDVFSVVCSLAGESLSQRDIAKKLKVSPTSVGYAIKKLKKDNVIKVVKTKTVHFISLNRDERKAFELKQVENLKNIYVSGLSRYLEQQFFGGTIVLFGSYSKGEDTVSSDIDIAIIGRKDKVLALESYEEVLKRKININFYENWKKIHTHLKNNILNGIVLHGGVEL